MLKFHKILIAFYRGRSLGVCVWGGGGGGEEI